MGEAYGGAHPGWMGKEREAAVGLDHGQPGDPR